MNARARELAARLSAVFLEDQAIAVRQADSQRRLTDANDRLWSGLAPDAFGLIYDGVLTDSQNGDGGDILDGDEGHVRICEISPGPVRGE